MTAAAARPADATHTQGRIELTTWTDRRVTTGPRLRDKRWPSSYDLCACGMAKHKTSRRCAACSHAQMKGDRRGYDACACGREKIKRSIRCTACVLAEKAARRLCGCGRPKHYASPRCRTCGLILSKRSRAA